jgi:hypothetical protein
MFGISWTRPGTLVDLLSKLIAKGAWSGAKRRLSVAISDGFSMSDHVATQK